MCGRSPYLWHFPGGPFGLLVFRQLFKAAFVEGFIRDVFAVWSITVDRALVSKAPRPGRSIALTLPGLAVEADALQLLWIDTHSRELGLPYAL